MQCLKSKRNRYYFRCYENKTEKRFIQNFSSYLKKNYDLNSEEGINRYKVFKNNLKVIDSENNRLGKEVYGITEFADLTREEFKEKYLMKEEVVGEILKENEFYKRFSQRERRETDLDYAYENRFNYDENKLMDLNQKVVKIDWRKNMNPARHQKECGSCWAFSSIGAVEGNYNIYQNKFINLSEQYLVDCDTTNKGCNGGRPERAFDNMIKGNGVVNLNEYNYKEKRFFCDYKAFENKKLNIVKSFDSCLLCSREQWLSLLFRGPIVVTMDADQTNFYLYKPKNEEPWIPDQCKTMNHGVIAVGLVSENGKDYLIVRNSWGTDWGFNGHFKVAIDNSCLITDFAFLPITQEDKPFSIACPSYFSDCKFQGKEFSTCNGVNDLNSAIGGPLKSLYPNSTPTIKEYSFFENKQCSGMPLTFNKAFFCLDDTTTIKNKKILSVSNNGSQPAIGCLLDFDDTCFVGNKRHFCENIPDLSAYPIKIVGGSFIINASSVIFYSGLNYTGTAFNGIISGSYAGSEASNSIKNYLAGAKSMKINP